MNHQKLILWSMAFFGMLLTAQLAPAQTRNCGPHQAVVERLAAGFGESRQVIALDAANNVLEVFASTETGTWTITLTQPGGPTRIVAVGDHYQHVAEPLPNTDEGA